MSHKPSRDYDSTIARIAGNIASGIMGNNEIPPLGAGVNAARQKMAESCVDIARRIVAEVKRTEPQESK